MNDFISAIKASVEKRVSTIPDYPSLKSNHLDFCCIFKKNTLPVIAEIKFASPSQGRIYPGKLNTVEIAEQYLAHGASALSILTEPDYFAGNIEYIRAVKQRFPEVPILLKDFILHPKQIRQGLAYGANAVLLIVAFLSLPQLHALYEEALTLGLTPIIEIHTRQELVIALQLNPTVMGINHRNLKTLKNDLTTSHTLIQHIPKPIKVIGESGIENNHQLQEMSTLGFNGFLIGTHFMKQENPGQALKQLLQRENHAY